MMGKALKQRIVQLTTAASLVLSSVAGNALAEDFPGQGVAITPIFSNIAEERFRGEIAIAGLKALGYDVTTPKETDYHTMLLALSYGDADFTVHMWDQLHNTLYDKYGGNERMVRAGNIIPGVLQGYQIDKKTADTHNITQLSDLRRPEIARLFDADGDGKADLIGCNPGWGCETVIDHHIEAYGLSETVSVNRGDYFDLMRDTIRRYKQGEPVLYYTWVPQWIAGEMVEDKDAIWLKVPHTDLPEGNTNVATTYKGKNLGFAVDQIRAVVNSDFADDNPAATRFLSLMQISAADESRQNLKMQGGEKSLNDVRRHASEWINANRATFNAWLAEARTAQ